MGDQKKCVIFNKKNREESPSWTGQKNVELFHNRICPPQGKVHSDIKEKEKIELVDILNHSVYIDGNQEYVSKAIRIYSKSIFDALNENDVSQIRFYKNEL